MPESYQETWLLYFLDHKKNSSDFFFVGSGPYNPLSYLKQPSIKGFGHYCTLPLFPIDINWIELNSGPVL